MKVLCFTYNAQHQSLCEKFYFDEQQQLRTELIEKSFFRFTTRNDCYNPLFFNSVAYQIDTEHPNVVAFTTTSDLSSGTYFHSHFLQAKMSQLGYVLLERDKNSNRQNTIRLSVYGLKRDAFHAIVSLDKSCDKNMAVVIYVTLKNKTLAFVAMDYQYNHADSCYRSILETYLKPLSLTGVFFMGILNYTMNNNENVCGHHDVHNVDHVYFDNNYQIVCVHDQKFDRGLLSIYSL